MTLRLSVNVNKIATLRNSRRSLVPDVVHAALACVNAGAGGITVHPRADGRHITIDDVRLLKEALAGRWTEGLEFNIEVPSACSMGNPHCTFFVDDLSVVDVAAIGPTIERHWLFPQKTNVHFVQIINRSRIHLRIWERGGGIPLGSGSCSCGAVVAGIRRDLLDNVVEVVCDGGAIEVRWDGVGSVYLIWKVQLIFEGTLVV